MTASPIPTLAVPSTMTLENSNIVEPNNRVWQIGNGEVKIPDPITFTFSDKKEKLTFENPILLGSGGGGAVFSVRSRTKGSDDDASLNSANKNAAIKVSWLRSSDSVKNECEILQLLEKSNARNVEKCLGKTDYPYDLRRAMIVLTPVVENDPVASLSNISLNLWPHAIQSIVHTLVDMLAANVVTVDVQPLISKETGDVLFIDFTEAKVLFDDQQTAPSFMDLTLVSSFCGEMMALIPTDCSVALQEVASKAFLQELKLAERRGVQFPEEFYTIFETQSVLMSSPDTLKYVESKIPS